MIAAKVSFRSLREVSRTVEEVLDQVERRGMKDALLKAATPMVTKTRELTPKRTGALRRSIGKKGRTNKEEQSAEVKVGPRSGYVYKGLKPARYAHLVEFGHQMVIPGGRKVGFVGPRSFMRQGFEATKDESRRVYAREIGGSIHRQFRKAKRRGSI